MKAVLRAVQDVALLVARLVAALVLIGSDRTKARAASVQGLFPLLAVLALLGAVLI